MTNDSRILFIFILARYYKGRILMLRNWVGHFIKCRFHDLRHTVCTKMVEAGVPESTMLAIMGHMSKKMVEKYSHIRMQAKRDAIQSIESWAASVLSNEMVKVLTQVNVFGGSKPS